MSRKPNLAGLLADTAGSTRKKASMMAAGNDDAPAAGDSGIKKKPAGQGRAGTKPITVHYPKEVRDQLKILAVQHSKTLHTIIAEAFNDLFSKYGKPEIAPATENK